MVARVETAFVRMWGTLVGAVAWDPQREVGVFEFDPRFLEEGLDLAPLRMPLTTARRGSVRFEFRTLPRETFMGLPGLLADALPDRFGNNIIDAWLARQGRGSADFSPVERLCYTGRRGIGALEFSPTLHDDVDDSVPVEVGELVKLAQQVTDERACLHTDLEHGAPDGLLDIIRVGTSAGGGRPKAVVAWNRHTGEIRSGQVDAPSGFEHWLLKFDGVRDETLGDPAGYGRIEFAYHLMAVAAGIHMAECHLLEENDRAHFMTRRFDRPEGNRKLHLQSLCAMAHFDFNAPAAHSYEQAFQIMRELRLPYADAEQQFRRMVLNILGRNQDDHTKNIAFLMDPTGRWRLSPAFDVTYAYNPAGAWTRRHQMSVNGKRDEFTRADLVAVGAEMGIKRCEPLISEIADVVASWPEFAKRAGVALRQVDAIGGTLRKLVG